MQARIAVLLLLAFLPGACDSILGSEQPVTRISWGTSFGECLGYCREQLDITSTEIRFTRLSWNPRQQPPLIATWPSSGTAWADLNGAIDRSGFQGLQTVYGCPDCTDGGAEWVEVERGGASKRVTFEYGHSPQALAPAVTELRSIRDGYMTVRLMDRAVAPVAGDRRH